mgnify:CR=1 FL=1
MADPAGQATRIGTTEAVAEERLQRAATYIEAEEGATHRHRGALARLVSVLLVGMSGLILALWHCTRSSGSAQRRDRENTHALYVAGAGLSKAVFSLQSGHSGALGAADAPVTLDQSRYYVRQEDLRATSCA